MKIQKHRPTKYDVRRHLTKYATQLIAGDFRSASNIERIMITIGKARKDFYKSFRSIEEMVNVSFDQWMLDVGNMPVYDEEYFSHIDEHIASMSPVYVAILISELNSDKMLTTKLNALKAKLARHGYDNKRFEAAFIQLKV